MVSASTHTYVSDYVQQADSDGQVSETAAVVRGALDDTLQSSRSTSHDRPRAGSFRILDNPRCVSEAHMFNVAARLGMMLCVFEYDLLSDSKWGKVHAVYHAENCCGEENGCIA
jgi:hypothetical protein